MRKSSKSNLDGLLSRHDYLVVQSNDLAKAFGNLKAFEHKLLDYCVSFVSQDSGAKQVFETTSNDVLRYFDLVDSGQNYQRIVKSFKTLNENTALYFGRVREDGKKSIVMDTYLTMWKLEMMDLLNSDFQSYLLRISLN